MGGRGIMEPFVRTTWKLEFLLHEYRVKIKKFLEELFGLIPLAFRRCESRFKSVLLNFNGCCTYLYYRNFASNRMQVVCKQSC